MRSNRTVTTIEPARRRSVMHPGTGDPTGLVAMIPAGGTFRYYTVTGSVPAQGARSYRLAVTGLVQRPGRHTLADLQAMPQTELVRDFHCVTGWRVPEVPWAGVRL